MSKINFKELASIQQYMNEFIRDTRYLVKYGRIGSDDLAIKIVDKLERYFELTEVLMEEYLIAKGWLTDNERKALVKYSKDANTIINVGIEYGASIHCLRHGSPNAKIVAIDLIGDEKFEGNTISVTFDSTEVEIKKEDFSILDSLSYPFVLFIKADSTELDIDVEAQTVFIDGGHDYKTVQGDIKKYVPLCTQYLLFHDYSELPMHAGVKKALDEWEKTTEEFEKIEQVDTIAVFKRII